MALLRIHVLKNATPGARRPRTCPPLQPANLCGERAEPSPYTVRTIRCSQDQLLSIVTINNIVHLNSKLTATVYLVPQPLRDLTVIAAATVAVCIRSVAEQRGGMGTGCW